MQVDWDYTELARAYLDRPDYAPLAIRAMLAVAGPATARACDVGAGVAHLTLPLLDAGLSVVAVEPNDAMMALGRERTASFDAVRWISGTGEQTSQDDDAFDIVTFGSSFNVTDRPRALREAARILRPGGWFSCMWNHRDLTDPLQARIEAVIREAIPAYGYGTRREDQSAVIATSDAFGPVLALQSDVAHVQSVESCLRAWRSHATVQRQAGPAFDDVIAAIAHVLDAEGGDEIVVPYRTSIWMAQRVDV